MRIGLREVVVEMVEEGEVDIDNEHNVDNVDNDDDDIDDDDVDVDNVDWMVVDDVVYTDHQYMHYTLPNLYFHQFAA